MKLDSKEQQNVLIAALTSMKVTGNVQEIGEAHQTITKTILAVQEAEVPEEVEDSTSRTLIDK